MVHDQDHQQGQQQRLQSMKIVRLHQLIETKIKIIIALQRARQHQLDLHRALQLLLQLKMNGFNAVGNLFLRNYSIQIH